MCKFVCKLNTTAPVCLNISSQLRLVALAFPALAGGLSASLIHLLQNSPDLLDHRPYTSQPELVSDISSSGSLQQCSVPPPARISAGGLLVCVEPRTATVEVHSLAAILRDTGESQELEMFPGPLSFLREKDCCLQGKERHG